MAAGPGGVSPPPFWTPSCAAARLKLPARRAAPPVHWLLLPMGCCLRRHHVPPWELPEPPPNSEESSTESEQEIVWTRPVAAPMAPLSSPQS